MFRRLHETGTNSKRGDSWSHIIIITFTSRSLNISFTNRYTVYFYRQPWSFKLPSEKYKIYTTLIWWPVNIYRTVSQNGAIPHINPSIYSIECTSKSFLLVSFFAKETAKMIELHEEKFYLLTGRDIRFRFTCERYGVTPARK